MKRELKSLPRAVKSVDDLPLFAWAAGQQAEKKRVEAAVLKNASEPTGFVATVKDTAVTDDILPALIALPAGKGAHR